MLNLLGCMHHHRVNLFWQTLLWSSLAVGVGMWAMKECGFDPHFCHCGHQTKKQSECTCGQEVENN